MIIFEDSVDKFDAENLVGFFVGWKTVPSREMHYEILKSSKFMNVAIDSQTGNVVGFVYAVTDGILSAYIPLIEVLPNFQGQGIGSELMRKMLKKLEHFYMVDLVCDENLRPFYKKIGMIQGNAMLIRNYDFQKLQS